MNTKKRSTNIQLRVTPTEKAQIEKCAAEYGGTVSDFIRSCISVTKNSAQGKQLQEIISSLCRLATLTNLIQDLTLRKRFEEEELTIWQHIK